MANVSAIKSGNWSDPTVWSTGSLPTSADSVFSNGFNVTINQNVTVLLISQSSESAGNTGGTFILTNGVVVNATGIGFQSRHNSYTGGFIIFNLSSPNSATLIGNFIHRGGDGVHTVDNSGTGTLNIIGNLYGFGYSGSNILRTTSTSTINITGNIYSNTGGTYTRVMYVTGNSTINITGNILNVATQLGGSLIYIASAATLNIVGTVYGGGSYAIESYGASYIKIIGSIIGDVVVGGTAGYPAINSSADSNINIFTGPFISHSSGIQPIFVTRMHYLRTAGSYYEFRNNSTNGALPPSPAAPATRLVSPDTAADAPIPANVRFGTSYALGAQTGTMVVPSAANVAKNVPVDNTVGTAILDAEAIWAVPLTSINTLNSIGRRVKNAATVETTGAQIQTTLNNNP
jgi:hypothetical protein